MATIASLLRERVSLQVNSVDRIFLAGYIPKLQSEGMLVRFLLNRGFQIPSPALLGKNGSAYVRAIERFAKRNRIPVVHFKAGESKELTARRFMREAERQGRFGVVMIGVAQERCPVWRGYRSGGPDWHPHFSYRRMSACPNHYYFYIRDCEWGPAFIKTVAYAPYGIAIYLNGHEWAKRQASAASPSKRWITGFAPSRTPARWLASARPSTTATSRSSGSAGRPSCPPR